MTQRKSTQNKDTLFSLRSRKSKTIVLLIFTFVHLLLTVLFFFWSYSAALAQSNSDRPPTLAGKTLVVISDVFQWPFIASVISSETLRTTLPSYTVYIVAILNSLFWALIVLGLLLWLKGTQRARKKYRYR